MRIVFLKSIRLYQKYVSPRKGYCCAYGMLHKHGSCSTRVYSIIQNSPRATLLADITDQFRACKKAHLVLSSENKDEDEEKEKDNKGQYWCTGAECGFWACFAAGS